jgi:hypothetical protein
MQEKRNMDSSTLKIGLRNQVPGKNGFLDFRPFIGRHYSIGDNSALTTELRSHTIRCKGKGGYIRRFTGLLSLATLTAAFSASLVGLPLPASQVIQGQEVEQFLKKGRFVAKEPLGAGVTGSLKVTLQQGDTKQFAVLKTVDQKRPGLHPNASGELELDFQDSWRTEVAAYELDKLIGLGMVPATIERSSPYENKPASLQLWVEASLSEEKRRKNAIIPPDAQRWADQLSNMTLFDALIHNMDRNPGNLLITDKFEVRLIDHSRSFRPNAELRNKEDLTRFSRTTLGRLRLLTASSIGKKLGDYLSLSQIEGLMKRRQLILDRADEMVGQYGENAVIFP